jgi:hypothetical protein
LGGAFFSAAFFSAAGAFLGAAVLFFGGFPSAPSSAPFTCSLSSLAFWEHLVSALLGAELERRECLPWSGASTGVPSWAFLFLHRHPLHHLLHPTSVDSESINVLE